MQGIDRIVSRIMADAAAECAAQQAAAEAEAEALREDYRRRAEALRAEWDAKAEKAAADRESRLQSAAQMEARKAQLAARQELLDEAFGQALEALTMFHVEQSAEFLGKLAAHASKTGAERIVLTQAEQKYRAKVAEIANRRLRERGKPGDLSVSGEVLDAAGGLLLRDGDVTVNCAYETLIRMQREEMSAEVALMLFA
jgi:V/A-type H+-transporting ATPase subunit E